MKLKVTDTDYFIYSVYNIQNGYFLPQAVIGTLEIVNIFYLFPNFRIEFSNIIFNKNIIIIFFSFILGHLGPFSDSAIIIF